MQAQCSAASLSIAQSRTPLLLHLAIRANDLFLLALSIAQARPPSCYLTGRLELARKIGLSIAQARMPLLLLQLHDRPSEGDHRPFNRSVANAALVTFNTLERRIEEHLSFQSLSRDRRPCYERIVPGVQRTTPLSIAQSRPPSCYSLDAVRPAWEISTFQSLRREKSFCYKIRGTF